MFLNTRLLSGSPAMVLIGLVFVAGMAAGAALQARVPAVVTRAAVPQPMEQRQAEARAAPLAPDASIQGASLQGLRLAAGGHPAEVLRVNDGDTFEARVHVWPGMQVTTKVRLRGIDAAEFRSQCTEEYRLASAARDALARMLAEGGVTIGRIDFDKYGGRVVANAATRSTPDISEALLKTGYVRAYDGGRRDGWCGSQAMRQ
jgi:endonuclease YncB( thermonuclease family)